MTYSQAGEAVRIGGHDFATAAIDSITFGPVAHQLFSLKDSLVIDLSTDKAIYAPGEVVSFSIPSSTYKLPAEARVRYRCGADVVLEHPLDGRQWTWLTPLDDGVGYLADIYVPHGESQTLCATIGVDVSSSWKLYPRYGFVADYDISKVAKVESEMEFLNRCHINGVQFYDWHNKHHWPLGGTRDELLATYKDVANRQVVTSVVKKYIDVQHRYGMKAMFYNLCFGALEDGADDGVNMKAWAIYKDKAHKEPDAHSGLPASWKSQSIYLMDPSNLQWQNYLGDRNDEVYCNLDFDGFHVDQLGYRGTRYSYMGNEIDLKAGYAKFLKAMAKRHPSKELVMNAVGGWGAQEIAGSETTSFLYDELWEGETEYDALRRHILDNKTYSKGTLQTVFAAYMNYGKASGAFNEPGVLLTDAAIFALGGAHLELGDHMLCNEYFPSQTVTMSSSLRKKMVNYYDFLVAYEQLLRGSGTETALTPTTNKAGVTLNAWPPQVGSIAAYSTRVGDRTVVSLLNFRQADCTQWRDLAGTMPEPKEVTDLTLTLNVADVQRVWVASPDYHGGAPQELAFTQADGTVTVTLPALKYWDMLVLE
ncbi:MAG: cycloisomaltooligosaccharide glucanotransferase [Bacteroidaceae bacterium]|nr:cycloisomaltooligosaccharide glucanotransferase [Bacteroidaceae bacterium]